jgi:hypothetical protein
VGLTKSRTIQKSGLSLSAFPGLATEVPSHNLHPGGSVVIPVLATRGCAGRWSAGSAGSARPTGPAAGPVVRNSSALVVGGGVVDGAGVGRVDTETDPGQEAVGDLVAEQNVLTEICKHCFIFAGIRRVSYLDHRVAGEQGIGQEEVFLVGGHGLGVGGVRRVALDDLAEALVKIQLADVVGSQVVDGVIGTGSGVGMDRNVDVLGAA